MLKDIQPEISDKKISTIENYTFRRTRGILDVTYNITLKKGDYLLRGKNKHGEFYDGPVKCLVSQNLQTEGGYVADCGIFIPKNNPKKWKIYYYTKSIENLDGRQIQEILLTTALLYPGGWIAAAAIFDPAMAFEAEVKHQDLPITSNKNSAD